MAQTRLEKAAIDTGKGSQGSALGLFGRGVTYIVFSLLNATDSKTIIVYHRPINLEKTNGRCMAM